MEKKENDVFTLYVSHGFGLIGTGGGCEAFKTYPETKTPVMLVTDAHGLQVPERLDDPILVGVYSDEDSVQSEHAVNFHFRSTREFFKICDGWK